MLRTRPDDAEWPGLARPVVLLVVAVVAANIVRTVDDIIASPAPVGQNVALALSTAVAALVILGLARHARTGQATGFAALAGAGLAIFLIFGADHGSELSSSQLLTVLPDWIRRWTVAANFVILVPVVVVVVRAAIHFYRYLEEHPITFRKQPAG